MKIAVSLLTLWSSLSVAGTLTRVTTADCTSARGSYLKLDRSREVLEARFASLPALTNLAEGQRMEISTLTEHGYEFVGGLVADPRSGLFGSVMLLTKAGASVTSPMSVTALFRDMAGGTQQEDLTCRFDGTR